jgi:hypothetical protein
MPYARNIPDCGVFQTSVAYTPADGIGQTSDLLIKGTADNSQNAPPAFSTRGITTVGDPATEAVYSASGCWVRGCS